MLWCPRCDEVFPEGPACPRCSTRLVDRDRGALSDELLALPELATIKVSRRDRRALERLSGPKAPSTRLLALAVAALVFAVGFLVGRLGSIQTDTPSVRALPTVEALSPFDVDGSAVYLLWTNDPLVTVAVQDLYSGDVVPRARLSPPIESSSDAKTTVTALDGSVAVVVADDDSSFVAFTPAGRQSHGWVPGVEAAWASPVDLLVRESDGSLLKWTVSDDRLRVTRVGYADRLLQTPSGALIQRDDRLTMSTTRADAKGPTLELPDDRRVLGTNGRRAILEGDVPELWDGTTAKHIRVQGPALAASFEPNGDRAGLVLRRGDELTVAVVDARGNAALKPINAKAGKCAPSIAWDRAGSWIYVAPGDGSLHAVEAAGGRIESVRTHGVGCGLTWIA